MNFFDQFTKEQLTNQYKTNHKGLLRMLNKAKLTGNSVNGYTKEQLIKLVAQYKILAS